MDCAVRGVKKEVRIDLASGDGHFHLLGRLPDRFVRTAKPFFVASFVFLQLDTGSTELLLAEKEVADAFWCSDLLRDCLLFQSDGGVNWVPHTFTRISIRRFLLTAAFSILCSKSITLAVKRVSLDGS